ncbi:MAG: winged helix-turn-helix domain-containing protein [Candidatus Hermodarchaeota archaeon]
MVLVRREGVLLEATKNKFENQAVLNPTVVQQENTLHLFYRAVKEGNYSSIGYCKLGGPLKIVERKNRPILFPEYDYEIHGTEDPRVVFLDGTYYMFYTAYDGKNALVAYATSKNLKTWEKHGIISANMRYDKAGSFFHFSKLKEKYRFFISHYKASIGEDVLLWEKDSFIFPKKYNNKFVLIHRVLPDIQIVCFDDFKDLTNRFWENYLEKLGEHILMEPKFGFESRNIGAGAPLIDTKRGWLMIFHSVEDSNKGRIYHANAALLDKRDPYKVIGRLKEPLFSPTEDYEKIGDVNNVVFPTGTAIFGDRLYIYYGAADKRIAVVSVNLDKLLHELLASEIEVGIGFLAGQIFSLISKEEKSLTQIKNLLNQNEKVVLMAIGWLSREDKVLCRFDSDELFVSSID